MTSKMSVVAGAAALAVVLGVLGWRVLPAAGSGEILVTADRAVPGPIRIFVAPWAARRVVPAVQKLAAKAAVDLGQGSTWPVEVSGEIRVDGLALDGTGRRAILDGGGAASIVSTRIPAALRAAANRMPPRAVLARPAALAAPLRTELAAGLPPGVTIATLDVSVSVPPEQARAAALSAARTGQKPPVARVVYIGLDAADWEIIDRMIAGGELPTFARLLREGARADLIPYEPMISPMLWTTALTGRPPDEHGVNDFTLSTTTEDTKVPMTSNFRKVPALWEILAAAGQPSGFANHWGTSPAEQVPGVLVSDDARTVLSLGESKASGAAAWPGDFIDSIRPACWTTESVPSDALRAYAPSLTDAEIADARRYYRERAVRDAWNPLAHNGRIQPIPALLLALAAAAHDVEVMTDAMVKRPELGVVSAYFEDIDLAGHTFMHLEPPPHPLAPADERTRFGNVIENVYRLTDAMLARIVRELGPDTVLVVHSDHGFVSGTGRPLDVLPFSNGQPVEWHRPRGMFLAWGTGVRRGVRVPPVSIFDIAPTILALRGVPAGENMPGRVRYDLFDESVAARLPRDRVPSWDALVAPRTYDKVDEAALATAQAEAIERLRGLGYVDVAPRNAAAPATKGASASAGEGAKPHPGAVYWRNLATYLMNLNRYDEAEQALLKANDIRPLPKTYQLISESRAARGDVNGAIAALEKGLDTLPTQMEGESVRWLVELRLSRHDAAGARTALDRYRSIAGKDPGVVETAEGLLAEDRGEKDAAKASYLRALDREPRSSRAAERFLALSSTPAERQRLESILLMGIAHDRRLELYWEMLGMIAAERGDNERAAAAFERAVETQPGNERALTGAAGAWLRTGQKDRARGAYEALARRGTTQPSAWVNLGSLRAEAGDWRGAAEAWEKAVQLGADSPQLRSALEDARRRSH